MGNEVAYTIMRNNYEVTVCCEEMGDLLIMGDAQPMEFTCEGETEIHVNLELLDDSDDGILILNYCPFCGKAVRLDFLEVE